MNPDDIRNRSFTSNEDLEYIEQHGHQMRHLKDWQARTYSLLEEMMTRFTPKDSHKKENRIRVYLDHNGFMENEMNMLIPLLERLKAGIDLPVLVFTSKEVKPAVFPEGYLLMERNETKNLSLIIRDMKKNGIKGCIVITCGRHLNVKSATVLADKELNISFLVSKMGNKAVFEKNGLAFQLLEPIILLENDFKTIKKPTVI
jgi:hypothetical protein